VERAIKAGKHVLSEKPVAGDLDRAQALIKWYDGFREEKGGNKTPLWGVAENFRFMESLQYAAQRVREIGGDLVTFRLQQNAYIRPENKYFNTDCASFSLLNLCRFAAMK
jgi:predicted dehydrogenase